MDVLVTGGAGFIGSHLVDALIDLGHHVIVVDSLIEGRMDNIQSRIDAGDCVFLQGDIRDSDFCQQKIPAVEMIYHFAADPDVRTSVPHPMVSFDHNMNGTLNILEFARLHNVKKMVFASSGGTVYGESDIFPLKESFVLRPISPYGASKAAAEMYLAAYAHSYQMKIGTVRFANIFGERSHHGVGYDFFHHLHENPAELTILGDGTQQKSYLHVSDAVHATILVGDHLDAQSLWYDYYNVGSEDWFTVDDIAGIYERELGLKNVKHAYTGGKKGWVGDVAKMILSIEKIKKIGFSPQISFQEGVHRYCGWLKKINSLTS